MLADGFSPIETDIYETENTILEIIPADLGNITDIDSALIVFDKANKKTLLNTNDCIYDEPLFISYKESVNKYSKDLDIATIGYTGAGPYPQMFYDESEKTELLEEADKKKKQPAPDLTITKPKAPAQVTVKPLDKIGKSDGAIIGNPGKGGEINKSTVIPGDNIYNPGKTKERGSDGEASTVGDVERATISVSDGMVEGRSVKQNGRMPAKCGS